MTALTVICILQTGVIALALALLYRIGERARHSLLDLDAQHSAERAELLERIQRPERPPHVQMPHQVRRPASEPSNLHEVGTVRPPQSPGAGQQTERDQANLRDHMTRRQS